MAATHLRTPSSEQFSMFLQELLIPPVFDPANVSDFSACDFSGHLDPSFISHKRNASPDCAFQPYRKARHCRLNSWDLQPPPQQPASTAPAEEAASPSTSVKAPLLTNPPAPQPPLADKHADNDVLAALESLPTKVDLANGNEVTLSPVLWRDFEKPNRVMVNVGLRISQTVPATNSSFYTIFNPRIVTTGVAAQRTQLCRREDSMPIVTPATTRSNSAMSRAASAPPTAGAAGVASVAWKKEKEAYPIEEVHLMKRNPKTFEVEERWVCRGPLEGGTLQATPEWPGRWLIDVAIKVGDGSDSHWLAARNRRVDSFE